MDTAPAHEIIFLNELLHHLDNLNPTRLSSAGMFRVLGRLVDYDPCLQKATLQSCFHHDHVPPSGSTAATTIDLSLDEDDPIYQDMDQGSGSRQYIDLTSATEDEGSDTGVEQKPLTIGSRSLSTRKPIKSPIEPSKPASNAPAVVISASPIVDFVVDTRLLGTWPYEPKSLFQFMGEVIYEDRQWMLLARSFRNMEGLDLFAYRQSILLMRELVRQ